MSDDKTKRAEWLIRKISLNDSKLNGWEVKFIDDLDHKLGKYGEKAFLSDRQMEVLEKISEKCA